VAREPREPVAHTATARVDHRTKRLVKRVQPGEIMVIDHADLDRVAAETIVEAQVGGVINAADSISGRYPNLGPLLVCAAGIPLIDGVGPDVMSAIGDGQVVTLNGGEVLVDGKVVAKGTRQSMELLEDRIESARQSMGAELERFAENTLSYLSEERHLLLDDPDIPDVDLDMKDRHVLIVVRGAEYKDDLDTLRRSGYLGEMRPLLVGVDGGADALLEIGHTPDLIIGDMDSVSERALRCGAALVVHGYRDGRAPGSERLDELGLEHVVYAAAGTSEDIAMLLAYEKGAELIVAVGTHSSMVEFFDKGRAGMASTFLVRMKVGPILVDAKGVSRLYNPSSPFGSLALFLGAFMVLLAIVVITSPALGDLVDLVWLKIKIWLGI
jgi:uncharacterized membrane-anchored protein